jgi:hypothetical protein
MLLTLSDYAPPVPFNSRHLILCSFILAPVSTICIFAPVLKIETPDCSHSTDKSAYVRLLQYQTFFLSKSNKIAQMSDIIWKAGKYLWKQRCKAQQAALSWDPLY